MHQTEFECYHRVVQILEFNALGAAVGCTQCDTTLQLADKSIAEEYFAFTHVSSKGADHDVNVLIHHSLIETGS